MHLFVIFMKNHLSISTLLLLSLCIFYSCNSTSDEKHKGLPNIVYILADDLGFGDVSAYNPDSKISTPNIDQLASEGMRFTDAHSPSSVCTPTRYGLLTGRYCWRSKLPRGVLNGYGQSLIEHEETTVSELLKRNGYMTGVVGKWHLGLDWVVKESCRDSLNIYGELPILINMNSDWIDFNQPPKNGPITHGFDYSYILPASLDMEPYCYLENDVLVSMPDQYTPGNDLDAESWATGAFWRKGRMSKDFDFYEVLPTFVEKAKMFIKSQAIEDKPFFLYLPLAAPHTPWVPKENYQGKSMAGQYGDFVQMVDAGIGEVLESLKKNEVHDNTLVFFSSDNGPFWKPEFIDRFDHKAAHIYRGMKADIWDGGHRIPFIVRWPEKVAANSQSDQLTTLTNLIATMSEVVGDQLKEGEGMDSQSILSVMLGGNSDKTNYVVHHSSKGMFAIRTDNWKLIEGLGSGGFSKPSVISPKEGEPEGQLYNMKDDPGEKINLYEENPGKVEELKQNLLEIKNMN